jgi:TATA-box binding protein (TBP) (component of TFIID and TFIIIB)
MAITMNIDQEWEKFISNDYNESSDDDEEEININETHKEEIISVDICNDLGYNIPKASSIYISTKTKIAYLTLPIELKDIFWLIPTIPYAKPCSGVIKKQMKFNSTTKEEVDFIKEKLKDENYYEEHIITHIDNPSGRIKYKDIRKVSIGISKKDLMSYRCKKKSAFYNCFVIILRMKVGEMFKEFHVKVFNTGKLEIPGVQSESLFELILNQVIETLQPYIHKKLGYKENTNETVLINSNFNCGFYINRETLFDILKMKYNLQCIYDPCSYPGIQCKFYYNEDIDMQNGCQISEENKQLYTNVMEVSFMIFRTGSVLIVGKCDESVLIVIYEFLKNIFVNEYKNISQGIPIDVNMDSKDKKKKIRKKNITVDIGS